MESKQLDVTSSSQVSDIKTYGNPDKWILVCKASSESQGWMKSTKMMILPNGNGVLVQTTTQQRNPDGSYSLCDALCLIPSMDYSELRELINN